MHQGGIGVEQSAVGRNPINSIVGVVDEVTVARFAIADLLFGAFALGDIQNAAADDLAARKLELNQPNIAGNIRAQGIAMDPLEIGVFVGAGALGPQLGGDDGMAPVRLKGGTEFAGTTGEQIFAAQAEEAKRVVVAVDEGIFFDVQNDDGIRGIFDQGAVVSFTFAQGVGSGSVGLGAWPALPWRAEWPWAGGRADASARSR